MSRPTNRWKLGLFVLLGFGTLMVTFSWLGAQSLRRDSTQLHVFFDQDVTGLAVGSSLYFRGIQIGRVAVIRAAPDRRHVEVLTDVFLDSLRDLGFLAPEGLAEDELDGLPPDDLRIQLVKSFITGVSTLESDYVDVERFPPPEYPFPVPRNTVHAIPSSLNQLELALVETFSRLPKLLDQTTASLVRIEGAIEELDPAGFSERAERMLTTIDEQASKFYDMPFLDTGTESFTEMRETVVEFRTFVDELRAKDGSWQRLLERYDELGARIDEVLAQSDVPATMESLRNTSGTVGDAGEAIGGFGRQARSELDTLSETLKATRRLLELLERDPAALLRGR